MTLKQPDMELKDYKAAICGISCFCDKVTPPPRASEEPVYFEDEELDAYKGIAADGYTPAQVAEFEEVLTTMRPAEVGEWLHSLHLRTINLPASLAGKAAARMGNGHLSGGQDNKKPFCEF